MQSFIIPNISRKTKLLSMTESIQSGFLSKESKHLKIFKKRWCILAKNKILYTFKEKYEGKRFDPNDAGETFDLTIWNSVSKDDKDDKKFKLFDSSSKKLKSRSFIARSTEDKNQWIDTITYVLNKLCIKLSNVDAKTDDTNDNDSQQNDHKNIENETDSQQNEHKNIENESNDTKIQTINNGTTNKSNTYHMHICDSLANEPQINGDTQPQETAKTIQPSGSNEENKMDTTYKIVIDYANDVKCSETNLNDKCTTLVLEKQHSNTSIISSISDGNPQSRRPSINYNINKIGANDNIEDTKENNNSDNDDTKYNKDIQMDQEYPLNIDDAIQEINDENKSESQTNKNNEESILSSNNTHSQLDDDTVDEMELKREDSFMRNKKIGALMEKLHIKQTENNLKTLIPRKTFIVELTNLFSETTIQKAHSWYGLLNDNTNNNINVKNENMENRIFLWDFDGINIISLDHNQFLYVSSLVIDKMRNDKIPLNRTAMLLFLSQTKMNGLIFVSVKLEVLVNSMKDTIAHKSVGDDIKTRYVRLFYGEIMKFPLEYIKKLA
eukprot:518269_1